LIRCLGPALALSYLCNCSAEARPVHAPNVIQTAQPSKSTKVEPHAAHDDSDEGNSSAEADQPAAEPQDDDSEPQDEVEDEDEPAGSVALPNPLDGLSESQIEKKLLHDPASLGSMSIGLPNSGRLINAVHLPESEYWKLASTNTAWATKETIEYLTRSLAKVHAQYPGVPKLYIGDISAQAGGSLSPHLSHQAGRDVDISYFYLQDDAKWYQRAGAGNLDTELTWAFVRALIVETDVRFILIDQSLQKLLRDHAEKAGEDPAWLDAIFHGTGTARGALIRHAPGHATHMHIRFDNPIAQETARRCYRLLIKHRYINPPQYVMMYKVKKGETLGKIAKRFNTTVQVLKRANGLKKSMIREGKMYKIPRQGDPPPSPPVAVFPRLLPPGLKVKTVGAR
jgi:penicillin-insensitive murein endopeptidase